MNIHFLTAVLSHLLNGTKSNRVVDIHRLGKVQVMHLVSKYSCRVGIELGVRLWGLLGIDEDEDSCRQFITWERPALV